MVKKLKLLHHGGVELVLVLLQRPKIQQRLEVVVLDAQRDQVLVVDALAVQLRDQHLDHVVLFQP